MTFYMSCRPIRYRNEIITPKECLKHNFAGINFTTDLISHNREIDGRWLYEIKLCEDYTDVEADELREVFIEGLAAFGTHLKTPQSAKNLACELTGLEYIVNGECIEPPQG